MCGIAGIINFRKEVDFTELKALCDILISRGPDAAGYFLEKGVALGHRRLSIIDLSSGDQPMYSTDKNVVLVYNGEMYNFLDLRAELEAIGSTFHTNSDTEVIIEGYMKYGIEGILRKAEGMFAFALFDKTRQKIYIARDKFGEKPLYYYNENSKWVFASELKALEDLLPEKKINLFAVNVFLSLSYIPAPYTIFEEIHKLEAGQYIDISLSGSAEIRVYYKLTDRLKELTPYTDFKEACEHLEMLLTESVRKRMIADVEVGSFLSGGIDSSIVTCLMAKISKQPVKTFSIGFKEKEYDESKRADLVARHTGAEHTVQYLDYKDVVENIDKIIAHFDEPFGDSSAIPSFYVAKLASKDVKVVLTGDCADELFGGYEKYLGPYYAQKFKKLPFFLQQWIANVVEIVPHNRWTNSYLRRIKKVIRNSDENHFELHYRYMCLGFSDEERARLIDPACHFPIKQMVLDIYREYTDGNDMEKGFFTDVKLVLEGDMLVKVDRMCMQNSLEARVPFLDSGIVEAAFKMPVHYKINGRVKKYILKKTFGKLLPPGTTRFRKKGFGIPVDYWFRNELKEELQTLLDPEIIKTQGLFNATYVSELMNEHFSGKANHKGKLWNLFVFQKWYNQRFS